MKQFLILFFICGTIYSQNKINNNPNDTLAVDAFGKKIELESNLDSISKWNNYIQIICKQRLKFKNLNPKIKEYYEISEFNTMITESYLCSEKGNIKKSIDILINILNRANPVRHKKIVGFVSADLGTNFYEEGEVDKTIYYYNLALKYLNPKTETYYISLIYSNLGLIFTDKNQFEKALVYKKKSLEIRLKSDNYVDIGNCYNGISNVYKGMNKKQLAQINLEKAIEYYKKANSDYDLSVAYFNYSKYFKNPAVKNDYIKKSFELSKSSKNLLIIKEAGSLYYKILKTQQKFDQSISVLESVDAVKDSMYKKENQNAVLKAVNQFESEKKESQIKALSQAQKITELENKRQKTTLYFLIFGVISILITGFLLFKRFKTKKQNELLKVQLIESQKTAEAEKNAAQSELKALKSQMNPHFIFNALNSIQEQFMFGDKLIANEQMANFTTLTREILNVSGKKKITIQKEIDILTKYLELEKMRFDKDFSYDFIVSDEIDEDYDKIPPMILQPFVENSIQHGLLHQTGQKKLSISFGIDANRENILCTIIDNGIGRQKSEAIKTKNNHVSFSTTATEQHLEILNKIKSDKKLIVYEDILDQNKTCIGTKVRLTIPII